MQTRIFHFIAWACLSSVSFLACGGDDTVSTGAGGSAGTGGSGTGGGGTATDGGGGTGATTATVASCATFDYATYTAGSTQRTLAADVYPIFQGSCALTGCHAVGGIQHPYLGPASTATPSPAQLTAIMTELGNKSTEATSANLVVTSDPANSWLMLKLDQDPSTCVASGLCANTNQPAGSKCGVKMPQIGTITPTQVSTIRDWIKQGAVVQ